MAPTSSRPWYLRRLQHSTHFQSVSINRLLLLLLAVFLLFSIIGFHIDLLSNGVIPYPTVIGFAIISGLNAVLWLIVLSRLPAIFIVPLIALQFFLGALYTAFASLMDAVFHLPAVPFTKGVHFASNSIFFLMMASYACFVAFIRREGKESFRLRNELELAHSIQKTLVPPITLQTPRFEVYGISCPSDKVGGDLVDALYLSNGDAVAYLADIAGHGLQAGILMGMLKTATRTALLDAGEHEAARTLPVLLNRLNSVLPEVKEPHMYATFTGLRLGADGSVYFALAASPPILQWHADGKGLSHMEEEQFPLGLLPVSSFDGHRLETTPGDLLVVATDGILEAANKTQEEFGIDRLKAVIFESARAPLAEISVKILEAARAFGKQIDDQTILIVRCL
jgi:serine phosphatase RsbU (regulator of sigma subunit)